LSTGAAASLFLGAVESFHLGGVAAVLV